MAVYNAQKITLDLFPVKQAKILSPKGILLGNNVYKAQRPFPKKRLVMVGK